MKGRNSICGSLSVGTTPGVAEEVGEAGVPGARGGRWGAQGGPWERCRPHPQSVGRPRRA